MSILVWINKYKHYIIYPILLAIIAIVGYNLYLQYTTKPATIESQKEAETVTGVQKAAENANVHITEPQAKEVTREIQKIVETKQEPVYIVQTTAEKAPEVIKEETKKNDADFSIVTNPSNPDEKVDLSKIDKDTKVELNQYNIKAYKKVIRTIEYSPQEKEIGFSIQKKINDSGTYMGVGISHDIDDHKTYAKIMVSW